MARYRIVITVEEEQKPSDVLAWEKELVGCTCSTDAKVFYTGVVDHLCAWCEHKCWDDS